MNILYLLVPIALALAAVAVYGFVWAVRSGQYEDVDTPAIRMMIADDEKPTSPPDASSD
jgi:cbb3-type cytochrome oxidase maturation protein